MKENYNSSATYSGPFYHGTSTALEINDTILPSNITGILREDFRENNRDVVYITTSLLSARKFAGKAAEKYGGNPIIYLVKPCGWVAERIPNEYICESAKVIKEVKMPWPTMKK